MELTTGKLSNYSGQAKEENKDKLDAYLNDIDKDLQNLWRIINSIAPLIGSSRSTLLSSSLLGYSFIPLVDPNPFATFTNYAGHTAIAYCNSNSSLYIYNTSSTAWTVEALT
jgi:hypothetical protein